MPQPPPLGFPDRTTRDLRLAFALVAEESADAAHHTSQPCAARDLAATAADLSHLAAAIEVLERRRDQLADEDGATG